MIKKLFVVAPLLVMLLAACGGQAPLETATPASTETRAAAARATSTEAPTATETAALPATPPSATSTPVTPVPTNDPNCTNSATFVADVTVPDSSDILGGTLFTKTWRVRNTGTCTWGPGYTLAHYSDERMGALSSIPLELTRPGESVDISIDLRAPSSIGTHRGNFVIKNPAGLIMSVDEDSRLWVIIEVSSAVTATASFTATMTPGPASGSATGTSSGVTGAATGTDVSSADTDTAACAYTTDRTKLTETLNAINAYRAQNGLPAYTVNTVLGQAAQKHANDMACNKLFGHSGSDKSTPQSRVAATGYIALSMSENVYGSYPPLTGQGVVSWWINDKTDLRHNQNLLSTTFTEIGIGYAFYDNFGYYVLVFGKPIR
ncbi:MAG TPA: CAP domain-containing protein [Anaerolineales bacterium]|nr:CAP domain-containing protein [Anaerolineales bacterium]